MIAAFAAIYIAWGSSYLAVRIGVRDLPPFLFGGLRFLSAGLIMLGYARWQGLRLAPLRAEWRDLLVTAVLRLPGRQWRRRLVDAVRAVEPGARC